MRLFAVSDLHIHGPDDPLYRSLLTLLNERAKPGDTVVLAGDIFDLFVGNKRVFCDRYAEFVRALRSAGARGVDLHYIEGNHDFLLKRVFVGIPRLRLHTQDVGIEVQGKRFFFAHGDLVDQHDYKYRALRAFFRSPVLKAFVGVAPGGLIDWIGTRSAKASRESKPRLPTELPIERRENLRNAYRSFAAQRLAEGYDFVVMGHCHDLDEMSFTVNGRAGQYINVGYPRAHGSYLAWQPGEEKIGREKLPE